jgi:hypothetical protein
VEVAAGCVHAALFRLLNEMDYPHLAESAIAIFSLFQSVLSLIVGAFA